MRRLMSDVRCRLISLNHGRRLIPLAPRSFKACEEVIGQGLAHVGGMKASQLVTAALIVRERIMRQQVQRMGVHLRETAAEEEAQRQRAEELEGRALAAERMVEDLRSARVVRVAQDGSMDDAWIAGDAARILQRYLKRKTARLTYLEHLVRVRLAGKAMVGGARGRGVSRPVTKPVHRPQPTSGRTPEFREEVEKCVDRFAPSRYPHKNCLSLLVWGEWPFATPGTLRPPPPLPLLEAPPSPLSRTPTHTPLDPPSPSHPSTLNPKTRTPHSKSQTLKSQPSTLTPPVQARRGIRRGPPEAGPRWAPQAPVRLAAVGQHRPAHHDRCLPGPSGVVAPKRRPCASPISEVGGGAGASCQ